MWRERLQDILAPDRSARPAWGGGEWRFFQICAATSALLFFVYAVMCAQFIHTEDYFQTIEFASVKLGTSSPGGMPWEYAEQMRSWLQPGIYYVIDRVASSLGIQRPLTIILLFRFFTASLYWMSLWLLILSGRRWLPSQADRRVAYVVATFLCLLPYLGVRTSSEATSAAMLCLGIVTLEWRANYQRWQFGLALIAGMFFGLCFEFRYVTVIMAGFAALSYLREPDRRVSLFTGLIIGGLGVIALGAVLDRWGYGVPAFPFYSYMEQNFVHGKAATQFGSSPFFAYLYLPLVTPYAPVMVFIVVAAVVAWILRPGNVLTWASLPYVVILSLTSHKEARFLYPIVPFIPFFVAFALSENERRGRALTFVRNLAPKPVLGFVVAWNICCLVFAPVSEFWFGEAALFRSIENEFYSSNSPRHVVILPEDRSYIAYGIVRRPGFIDAKVDQMIKPNVDALKQMAGANEKVLAVVTTPSQSAEMMWVQANCHLVYSGLPESLLGASKAVGLPSFHVRKLYGCGEKRG